MGSDAQVVVCCRAASLPGGLETALETLERLQVQDRVRSWPALVSLIADHPPQLLIIDREFWPPGAVDHPPALPRMSDATRTLMFSTQVDAIVVAEAVARGVHGCIPQGASASQWANAIEAVLRFDVAMPRSLLAQALASRLRKREGERRQPASGRTLAAMLPSDTPLTERERDVVDGVTRGLSNKEIGRNLGISDATVKTHLHHAFSKLKIEHRSALICRAHSPLQ